MGDFFAPKAQKNIESFEIYVKIYNRFLFLLFFHYYIFFIDARRKLMSGILEGIKIIISELGWNDLADIAIITFILYKLFVFIRDSRTQMVFKGVMIILATYLVATVLNLQMVSYIVDMIIRNAAIALVFVFQPEIRSVLEKVGQSKLQMSQIFGRDDDEVKRAQTLSTISNVVESAKNLKKQCMGALIVFEREIKLSDIASSGTNVDAVPNAPVISTIFFNKSPLHDGAILIRDNRICAAGCILPLTHRTDIDPNLGTRHRAAIGMSENSDAVTVVVSEESGRFSVTYQGEIKSTYDPVELSTLLMGLLLPDTEEMEMERREALRKKGQKFIDRITGSKKKEGAEDE